MFKGLIAFLILCVIVWYAGHYISEMDDEQGEKLLKNLRVGGKVLACTIFIVLSLILIF